MKVRFTFLKILLLLLLPVQLVSGQNMLNSLTVRKGVSLDGEWKIIVDPYENGYYNYRYEPFDAENHPSRSAYFMDSKANSPSDLIEYDFDKSKSLVVPGDWNTQMPQLYYYEGTVWYRTKFEFQVKEDERAFLYFGAINYKAEVYLNGQKLGTHLGGFTPFYFEITGMTTEGSNSLVVKVDNKRLREGVPTLNTDWWNYGGITRSVKLVSTPVSFIEDYRINLESASTKEISGTIQYNPEFANKEVLVQIPELKTNLKLKTDDNGKTTFKIKAKNLELWSPENPKRYAVTLSCGTDKISDTIGFRTIRTEGKKILLNDKPVFLKGISIHEEYAVDGGGRVRNASQAETLLKWAKELGCNFVRLAHYPHNEDMVLLADKMGIMIWDEVPVYWTIDWTNEATYANAENQFTEVIERDKNRASVIIWSLANETPVSDERTLFLKKLAAHVRLMDSTRLLSAAMEKHYSAEDPNLAIVQDPLADLVDIVSFNEYIGWYDGTPEKCSRISWNIPYNKPVFISEFGASAKQGLYGDKNQRFTEEYQEYMYEETLKMVDKIDGLCGLSPWILVDFRSPRRVLPGIQDDFNRKGLISSEGKKKKAFFVLQNYYLNKN
jgi:beta-glucuronidase